MIFTMVDDLGIKRECYLITEYEYNDEQFVVFTDMADGEPDEDFRYLVGKVINNKVQRVDKEKEQVVLKDFKEKKNRIVQQLKEELR